VFGANLRQILRRSVGTRSGAFLAGYRRKRDCCKVPLQRRCSRPRLSEQGLVTTAAALAVMLGADVGTARWRKCFRSNFPGLLPC